MYIYLCNNSVCKFTMRLSCFLCSVKLYSKQLAYVIVNKLNFCLRSLEVHSTEVLFIEVCFTEISLYSIEALSIKVGFIVLRSTELRFVKERKV